jgi:methyl-accepting chemotaxis protein
MRKVFRGLIGRLGPRWIRNVRIGRKLVGGYVIVAIIAGVIGYIGIHEIRQIDQMATELYRINTKPLGDVAEIATNHQKMLLTVRDVWLEKERNVKEMHLPEIKNLDQTIQLRLSELERTVLPEDIKKQIGKLKGAITTYQPLRDKIVALSLEGKESESIATSRGEAIGSANQVGGCDQEMRETHARPHCRRCARRGRSGSLPVSPHHQTSVEGGGSDG